MSLRLVERTSKFLAARTGRRGFLARTAVVGSALSVGPVSYLLRPGSAYAAVCRCGNSGCGCGSACCDGYTDFCCVINNGKNACPTGTVAGGWWKADGTAFCAGPRFYIDCNYPAGVSNCHCGNNDCNHRKVGCTFFRYGQCHQEIGSLGAIACRVVACTPPWQIDGSCAQVSATDQATADHTADCPPPPPPVWRPWFPLAGALASGPGITAAGPGNLHVFARGTDDRLWHMWFDGAWHAWESLGGALASGPTAAASGPDNIHVFVRGTDDQLWHRWYNHGWSVWESLGGDLVSDPAAAITPRGDVHVFVRGTDDQLWHKWYDGAWHAWESLGGALAAAPGVTAEGPGGTLHVFVRGVDGQLWHKWYDGVWHAWEGLGGAMSSGPAAASWTAGRVDVFVQGTDDQLWHRWYHGRWQPWETLGGSLTSRPGAGSWKPERLDVFVRGTDNQLWWRSFNNGL